MKDKMIKMRGERGTERSGGGREGGRELERRREKVHKKRRRYSKCYTTLWG